jgi:hypothetical protein
VAGVPGDRLAVLWVGELVKIVLRARDGAPHGGWRPGAVELESQLTERFSEEPDATGRPASGPAAVGSSPPGASAPMSRRVP